ncbi:MAG: radical SAM protein [Kiritimatiellae bacterium]|nr:radical SAM protein [Kiritimatiellia bacterium]
MNKTKIFIAGNQVCMKRGLDAERLQRYFRANQCELAESPQDADILVALTCAFIGSYVKTAVAMVESLKRYPGRLIVLGCLPAMNPDELESVFTGPNLATRDFDTIDSLFPEFTVPWASIPDANVPDVPVMTSFDPESPCPIYIRNAVTSGKKPGPFLRIAWGCNNRCSYCSHPAALGPFKSKPLEICLQEYAALLAAGHKHVVFHANDPSDYGLDIGLTYPHLLQKLDEITEDPSVHWTLADVNPARLVRYVDDLLPFFQKGRVTHLSVPIQTGSPRLLHSMRRYPYIDRVAEAFQKIRAAAPNIHLITHLIAGFPGETMEDIDQTVEMVEQCSCNRAMIFPYSANPGTDAAKMEPQFTQKEINDHQSLLCERLKARGLAVDRFQ